MIKRDKSLAYSITFATWKLQMHKKETAKSVLIGKDNFSVTIYPNVDYAFIVALVVILDGINNDDVE
jgi:uncharacterized protein YxjI